MSNKELPDFIIAGAPKAGTTSLSYYLNNSPECECITTLENGSEPEFFSKKYQYGIEWYKNLFKSFPDDKIYGEKSVSYMIDENVPARIYKYLPNIKLIFILRNPIDRAYSQYKANYQRGTEFLSFKSAIKQENLRRKFFKNNYSYITRGKYSQFIHNFLSYFTTDQMLFILYEEFKENPVSEFQKICDFLNIDNSFLNHVDFTKRANVSLLPKNNLIQFPIMLYNKYFKYKVSNTKFDKFISNIEQKNLMKENFNPLDANLRSRLIEYYRPYNKELGKIIDKDLSIWEK